jgi:hypothetical protein
MMPAASRDGNRFGAIVEAMDALGACGDTRVGARPAALFPMPCPC